MDVLRRITGIDPITEIQSYNRNLHHDYDPGLVAKEVGSKVPTLEVQKTLVQKPQDLKGDYNYLAKYFMHISVFYAVKALWTIPKILKFLLQYCISFHS